MLVGSIDGDRMIQILNGFVGDLLDKCMRDIDNGFPDDNLAAYGEVVAMMSAASVTCGTPRPPRNAGPPNRPSSECDHLRGSADRLRRS